MPCASEVASIYPLQKIVRGVVKLLMMNELEILFLSYILEEGSQLSPRKTWPIDSQFLRSNAMYFKDFLNISEISKPLEYKAILLYLILCAYHVKVFFNFKEKLSIFTPQLAAIDSKF